MDEQTTERPEALVAPEMSVYEQLCKYLYDYRFGRITFLELLDKWREVLSLPTNREQTGGD